ncbi:MAG TPA: hypothetical protein VK925_08895 [Jiangellaceae bacterium]|nr:hypothetical protein [Jiangellaceae bacterium]
MSHQSPPQTPLETPDRVETATMVAATALLIGTAEQLVADQAVGAR